MKPKSRTAKTAPWKRRLKRHSRRNPSPAGRSPSHEISELPRKYYLDGVAVYIIGEQAYELDPQENVLRTVQFTDYVAENVRRLNLSAEHLQQIWPLPEQRAEILEQLRRARHRPGAPGAGHPPPRSGCAGLAPARGLQRAAGQPQGTGGEAAPEEAEFLQHLYPRGAGDPEHLLDKYADFGIGEWENLSAVLSVPPFSELGTPLEITQRFGGPQQMRQAVDQMQQLAI